MRLLRFHRGIWGRRNVLMMSFWYFALIFSAFLYYTYARWRPAYMQAATFNVPGAGAPSGGAMSFTDLLWWQREEATRVYDENPSVTGSRNIVAPEEEAFNMPSIRRNQQELFSNADSSGNSDARKSNSDTNKPQNPSVRKLERDAEYEVDSEEDIRLPVTDALYPTTGSFENITIQRPLAATVEGYKRIESEEPPRLHCGRCAVVSSSGHLINQSKGREIDSAHCVLRMNSAPTAGYEDDVGTRTTVRVIGHVNMLALNCSRELQHEIFVNRTSRAEVVIVPWLNRVRLDKETNVYYRIAKNFSKTFPEVQFYLLTPEKSKLAEDIFKSETGLTPQEANTWLTTGWMTLLFAIDVCETIDIYGLVEDSHCREHPNDSTPYHYYEPEGIIECKYYQKSEERLTGGHLFITEKAVFARWAHKFNFRFHVPAWNVTANVSLALETPFLKRFYQAKRNNRSTMVRTRRIVRRVVRRVIIRRRIQVVKRTKP